MPRIHVTGASGTGASTLARALAENLRVPWLDSDDCFRVPTVPPCTKKRDAAVRDRRLGEDLRAFDEWVWSGSAVRWEHGALDRLTLCVFLTMPAAARMERLRRREAEPWRGMPRVSAAEARAERDKFLAWAERYDE
jgi:adenylate kinase family enzyme